MRNEDLYHEIEARDEAREEAYYEQLERDRAWWLEEAEAIGETM